MRSAAPVLLLGVGMAVAAAATPQHGTPPPILSVKTDLVTLPVTVLDGLGVFVTGLREEHFAVYDGGERQTISFFTSEAVPATIGLVIDSSGSMRGLGAEVAAAAAAFAAMSHQLDEFFTVTSTKLSGPGFRARWTSPRTLTCSPPRCRRLRRRG